jgi:glycosyltransferase involved in cell wall biosynthesis
MAGNQKVNQSRFVVSIVIPAFNRVDLLKQALQSVLAQTYQDYEVIVVDDGSDCILRDAIGCDDPRVKFVRQENAGLSAARNTGIRGSSGRYIAFLDSDDMWYPAKLERQVAILEARPDVCVVYGDYDLLVSGEIQQHGRIFPEPDSSFSSRLLHSNLITGSASSVMVRRAALDAVGVFEESLRAFEDMDLWRRLSVYGAFCRISEVLVTIRIHGEQSQKNAEFMQYNAALYVAKLIKEVPPCWSLNKAAVMIIDHYYFAPALKTRKLASIGEGFSLARRVSMVATMVLFARFVYYTIILVGSKIKRILLKAGGI